MRDWPDTSDEEEIASLANDIAHCMEIGSSFQYRSAGDLLDGVDILPLLAEDDAGRELRNQVRARWLEMARDEAKRRIDAAPLRRCAA